MRHRTGLDSKAWPSRVLGATSPNDENARDMNLVEFGFVYVGLLGVFLFVLLFGETPLFQATPVSFVHWLITSGVWEGLW